MTDQNGCEEISSFYLYEPNELSTYWGQVSNVDCHNGSNGILSAYAAQGNSPYTFDWSNGDLLINSSTSIVSGLSAGTYAVTITDQNGCFTRLDTFITAPGRLTASASGDELDCFGDNDGTINVVATGGTAPYFYSLNGGITQTSGSYSGLIAGNYTIEVSDASGCVFTTSAIIDQPDSVLLAVPNDMQITFGDIVPLYVQLPINAPTNPVITWTPSTGLSCTDCYQLNAQPSVTTRYTVQVTGNEGCVSTADVLIEVDKDNGVFVPNGFSPNGDKNNDVFMLYSSGAVASIEEFMVFDRWGELICYHKNGSPNYPAYGWDGTFKGKKMNTGVFVYFITVRYFDGSTEVFKGDLTLIR